MARNPTPEFQDEGGEQISKLTQFYLLEVEIRKTSWNESFQAQMFKVSIHSTVNLILPFSHSTQYKNTLRSSKIFHLESHFPHLQTL